MPTDPEPFSDAEVDAALRELVGEELRRGRDVLGSVPPAVAAAHVRRAAEIAQGDVATVAGIDEARARRAAGLVRRRRRVGIAAGWAAAGIVVLGGASTGLAAAEVLPRPAARVFAAAADAVGLPVPSPVERAAEDPTTTTAKEPVDEIEVALPTTRPTVAPAQATPPPSPQLDESTAAAVEVTTTTAAPTTTVPATTSTSAPACPSGSSSSSSSSSSASTSSSSTSSTSSSTSLVPELDTTTPDCEVDPPAEGAGAEPTTTTSSTVPDSTTTTADPGATADG